MNSKSEKLFQFNNCIRLSKEMPLFFGTGDRKAKSNQLWYLMYKLDKYISFHKFLFISM